MAGSANNKAQDVTDGTRQRKEVYGEKREKNKKNKVEEIQLANLASLGSLASNEKPSLKYLKCGVSY